MNNSQEVDKSLVTNVDWPKLLRLNEGRYQNIFYMKYINHSFRKNKEKIYKPSIDKEKQDFLQFNFFSRNENKFKIA
jgi:hypothetical protein